MKTRIYRSLKINTIDRGIDKDVVHIYNGVLLSHKKEQNFTIFNNMDGLGGPSSK